MKQEDALIISVMNSPNLFYIKMDFYQSYVHMKHKRMDSKCITGEDRSNFQQLSPSFPHPIIAIFIIIKEQS